MIPRYEVKEISNIWSDQNKFETFFKVELALLDSLEKFNIIPKGTSEKTQSASKVSLERIEQIEEITKHDVIAFCSSITENLDPEVSKYFHFGCTSSDIIDTAMMMQIQESLEIILADLSTLCDSLKNKALQYKDLLCMGRSHGMNAEPMSFGSKFLSFYTEFKRREQELKYFIENDITGQLSGAVGNYTVLSPEIERHAMELLKLKTEPISTQVIPRDRITKLVSITAMIASSIERLVFEIRHLHHSDLGEVFEGFSKGQKGSSTMPHKKNPISAENLSGLVRVIRSHLSIAHENNALWHERDISHSSSERMMIPDNLGLTCYALRRLSSTVDNLVVNQEHIEIKVLEGFSYLSSYILHELIAKCDLPREAIYKVVQEASFKAKSKDEFFTIIQNDPEIKDFKFNLKGTASITHLKSIYLRNIDSLFDRVLNQYKS